MIVGIIGCGLIGSSLALAFQDNKDVTTILICDNNPDHLEIARQKNLGHEYFKNPEKIADRADVIFICTPLDDIFSVAKIISPYLSKHTIISDVGSVKAGISKDIPELLPKDCQFIPGHPVAGTEFSGPEAGRKDLFTNRKYILTPSAPVPDRDLETLHALIASTGAEIEHMDPHEHDQIFAITSHLVHVLAFSAVLNAERADKISTDRIFEMAGPSFSDLTRVARSDPDMWEDIFRHNAENISDTVERFIKQIRLFCEGFEGGDPEKIRELICKARELKLQQLKYEKL